MTFSDHVARAFRMLAARRVVPRQTLMDELGVSRATLTRVIAFMRNSLNQEIDFDRDNGGYILRTRPSAERRGDLTMLPGLWLSLEDAYALLQLLNAVRGVDPGLLRARDVDLRALLKQMLDDGDFAFRGINRRLRFELPSGNAATAAHLAALSESLRDNRRVDLNIKGNNRLERVSPQYLVLRPDGWHVCIFADGWPEEQRLRLDDIKKVEVLPDAAIRKPGIDAVQEQEERAALGGAPEAF